MQAFTLQFAGGSGAAAGVSVAACAAVPDDADTLGFKPGAVIETSKVYINTTIAFSTLFYPNGISLTRIAVERDAQGRVTSLTLRDDRHEERWERTKPGARIHTQPE